MCLLANLHFLGIGAQKAATTWLYHMLKRHPQLWLPPRKEIHFWDKHYEKGLRWYASLFTPPQGRLSGEITPAYAILPNHLVQEMSRVVPHAKLIYIIRNPIQRAWSAALMALRRAEMQLHETSDQWFIDHFNSAGSLARGDYETTIRTYRRHFPSHQLLILRYEDVQSDPRTLLIRIAQHLQIDPAYFQYLDQSTLNQRIFASKGQPIRPSLLPVLQSLYHQRIKSLADYLNWDLNNWHDVHPHPSTQAESIPPR